MPAIVTNDKQEIRMVLIKVICNDSFQLWPHTVWIVEIDTFVFVKTKFVLS